jgi:hypothetical protein
MEYIRDTILSFATNDDQPNSELKEIEKEICKYRLKDYQIRTKHIDTNNSNSNEFECRICLESNLTCVSELPCKHYYCEKCTDQMTVNSMIKCALCSREFYNHNSKYGKLSFRYHLKKICDVLGIDSGITPTGTHVNLSKSQCLILWHIYLSKYKKYIYFEYI